MPVVSFKDFIVADPIPNNDPLIANQQKQSLEELTATQRLKKSRAMRRNKSRLKIGRKRSLRRSASNKILTRRAGSSARRALLKKMLNGRSKNSLSNAGKSAIEKRLKQKAGAIKAMTRKLLPAVRARDRARRHK